MGKCQFSDMFKTSVIQVLMWVLELSYGFDLFTMALNHDCNSSPLGSMINLSSSRLHSKYSATKLLGRELGNL